MFNVRKRRSESAEFAQLVECCRLAFSPDTTQSVRPPPAGLDWNGFLHLARRHRVQGLVWRGLHKGRTSLPTATARSLEEEAHQVARDGMKAAVESGRLLDALTSAGVTALFLKGLPLGALAYGDPFVKMSWDIDVLIDIAELAPAEAVLKRLGYDLVNPPGRSSEGLQRWHQARRESEWRKHGEATHLELHTRLTDNVQLLPGMNAKSPQQLVAVAPGIALPTLAPDEQFAYLCVHGSSSAWFRLKWLADLSALLERCSTERISQLYRRAQDLGAGRAAAQALLLARDMFGTGLEPTLARELESDRASRWLARIGWRQMTRVTEPTQVRFGTVPIHLTQFLLRPGRSFKWGELRRQFTDALGNRA